MTCSNLTRPESQDLFNRYQQLFQNTVLGGSAVIPESNEWYAIAVNYAMAEEFYALTDQAFKERDPRTACFDNLLILAERDGVYPRPSVPAQGYVKLTGTPNTALPAPLEFTIDGSQFITSNDSTQVTQLSDQGVATVRVRAIIPGESGNLSNQTTGMMTTVVAGVDQTVEVCGGSFCGGTDEEGVEAFRSRYLRRLQYQPRATQQWMVDKFLEWPCVTRAMVRAGSCCECGCEDNRTGSAVSEEGCSDCGCADCGGKMHFYVMFGNTFPNGIAPREVLDEVQEWMFGTPQGYGAGQVEIGVCGRVYEVKSIPINLIVDMDGCPSSNQLSSIRGLINEFFTTVEPSKPLNTNSLSLSIQRSLGSNISVEVSVNFVNEEDEQHVYSTVCSFDPDCDYMFTLDSVSFANQFTVEACP